MAEDGERGLKCRGRVQRQRGDRAEREVVSLHCGLGVHAERYPLSGAARGAHGGADVDVYAFGRNAPPLVCEVKSRKNGAGFALIERWLGEGDALFLRRARAEPVVVVPWATWARLMRRGC